MSFEKQGLNYHRDTDGIVTLIMDMPGPVNTMNDGYRAAMTGCVDKLELEKGLTGVVLASAKKTFFAGGDIKEMLRAEPEDKAEWFEMISHSDNLLRRLEKLPVPVVAAINGAALGGGLEICLACNRRIIVDSPKAVVGCPEVTIGLIPGAGGVVRSIHMLGLEKALPLMLEGATLLPAKALEVGLVDELVGAEEELVPTAKAWIRANPESGVQPWDQKGHNIPGGNIWNPKVQATFAMAPAKLFKKTRGLLPAPEMVLSLAGDTMAVGFDAALDIQNRLFVDLLVRPETKNIMNAHFIQMNKVNSGVSRPQGYERSQVRKLGVLGAGMMGQGIAYAAARVGIEVVLTDMSLEAAEMGKAYSETLLDKQIRRGRSSDGEKADLLGRIKPSVDNSDLSGCDLIIEAVFENAELKARVIRDAEPWLADTGIFGSNTSTLPITMLAEASEQPENFIGIHFFSPVDKMRLVEIICGKQTSDETLARVFDFVRQIHKTPIVVNDSLGFFTSRVFGTFMDEGCRLLEEGLDPILIDSLGKQLGMPVGPLAVHDEVSQELTRTVAETHRALGLFCSKSDSSASVRMAEKLIGEYSRGGRLHGGGFYEYPAEGDKHIWPRLYELFHKPKFELPHQDIKDRILFRQVIEALKCLQEHVLRSVSEGNIGSIYGIGAPLWTGGFIQFVNTYGLQRCTARCAELEAAYGDRFKAPGIVAEKLARGEIFQ